ncbi:MAG: tetratricopeptide repeat protein [SAR324 cluster bacterium]|nr:tetratricopeptide repeat protein [SAR324 cluster bacterium]
MESNEELIDKYLADAEKLMSSKLYERSMIEFSKALELNEVAVGRTLEGIYQRCMAEGNYAGLIAVGSNLLLKKPSNTEMAILLGNAYRRIEDFTQAEKLYEHCIQYDPDHQIAAYSIAATMARSDLYDNSIISAISEFESMTEYKLPDNEHGEQRLEDIQREILSQKKTPPNSEKGNADSESSGQEKSEKSEIAEQKKLTDWAENIESELQGDQQEEEKQEEKPKAVEINPIEIFQYIRSKIKVESAEGFTLTRSLGFYCLRHDMPDLAWRAFTRVSFVEPEIEDLHAFVAIASALRKKGRVDEDKLISFLGKYPHNRYVNVNLGFMYQQQGNALLARKYFIQTKMLLDKSEGYYDMSEFRALGDKYYQDESYTSALKVYRVILEEKETIKLLSRIGDIYIKLEQYKEALECFHRIRELSPDNTYVKEMFQELNQKFLQQAEILINDRKFSGAKDFLELSGQIKRTTSVVERLIDIYNMLQDEPKIKLLREELAFIKAEEAKQEKEKHRQERIAEARKLSRRQPHKAIEFYEDALRLKPDREVFLKLAALYQKTRQLGMVEDLTQRFNKMVELEQKRAQYEEDLKRSKRAAEEDEED